MKRVYIAGAMTNADPLKFLENLRLGIRLSAEALMAGHAVFSPFIDYSIFLQLRDNERITDALIKQSSMEWLKHSDAILLVPGWEYSKGTQEELSVAKSLFIPIFSTLENLNEWSKG